MPSPDNDQQTERNAGLSGAPCGSSSTAGLTAHMLAQQEVKARETFQAYGNTPAGSGRGSFDYVGWWEQQPKGTLYHPRTGEGFFFRGPISFGRDGRALGEYGVFALVNAPAQGDFVYRPFLILEAEQVSLTVNYAMDCMRQRFGISFKHGDYYLMDHYPICLGHSERLASKWQFRSGEIIRENLPSSFRDLHVPGNVRDDLNSRKPSDCAYLI